MHFGGGAELVQDSGRRNIHFKKYILGIRADFVP